MTIENPINEKAMIEANPIFDKARDKNLSLKERIDLAIELAAYIQKQANLHQSLKEKNFSLELSRMMKDPNGKTLTVKLTDQAFRSAIPKRVADQMVYLLSHYGLPKFLTGIKKVGLYLFQWFKGKPENWFVPLTRKIIRNETSRVILPGEDELLRKHLLFRKNQGVRVNINHLGEAILGEEEAKKRLQVYLKDLQKPEIDYISVKISTLFSQINLLSFEDTLEKLAIPLRTLLEASQKNLFKNSDGQWVQKFVNLDMEEYKDLQLTVELFIKVLSEKAFKNLSAGIVLQSYLPDSFEFQKKLTEFALKRISEGGAPIKIRLVKGANLAMEKVEGALKGWPQAPFEEKNEVDANFKKMLEYAFEPVRMKAVRIGIGSHNLFDIAYALILREERNLHEYVDFEMLEGMADASRKIVQKLSRNMVLYCPAAEKNEFQNAVAYFVRRLDENTGPENFLRFSFNLKVGSSVWNEQAERFAKSCHLKDKISNDPKRTQNRYHPNKISKQLVFENEPDTDWSLEENQKWASEILLEWKDKEWPFIPLIINGEKRKGKSVGKGEDPSLPGKLLFTFAQGTQLDFNKAILASKKALKNNSQSSIEERAEKLHQLAHLLRESRKNLLGAMIANTGKSIPEADSEISEAIDFAEYYRLALLNIKNFKDVVFAAKGIFVVASPWNFPCSIPAGGIMAALATGNAVLFKPAPEAVGVGFILIELFYKAGFSHDLLHFVPCQDEDAGYLIQHPDIHSVILTGATSTAELLFKLRPGLDLMAETGGKNSIIVTALADRDLAVKDIVQSAFGYSGQKCSACSLVIVEEEVFEDPLFKKQLLDATQSLKVGSAWDPSVKITPLIRPPEHVLKQAIEEKEWLLKPAMNEKNSRLMSPGIKWDIEPGSNMHMQELFGPVIGVMSAKNLHEAIEKANQTSYGLTAGLHSLDEREHKIWLESIKAGNCYINRGITGAIVQRQPFGGTKKSVFGSGAKAGGPNYLFQMMHIRQRFMPGEKESLTYEIAQWVDRALPYLNKEQQELFKVSAQSYTYYWKHYFSKSHDPSKVLGQINLQIYKPVDGIQIRIHEQEPLIDILRVLLAAKITKTPFTLSGSFKQLELNDLNVDFLCESEKEFIERISSFSYNRVRLLSFPSDWLVEKLSLLGLWILPSPVLANGRFELLHYLREISLSADIHRYGYIEQQEAINKN